MSDSGARITRIEMPDGTPVWARISGAEELERRPAGNGLSYTDTGFSDFADQVQARVESLQGVVTSVARSLAEPLRAVRPDEVSVEFGIELTAKAGKVVGLLADGEAKGAIKVTLTWSGGGPAVDPSITPQVPAQAAAPPTPPVPSVPPAPSAPPAPPAPPGPAPAGSAQPGSARPDPASPPSHAPASADDASAGASPGAPAHPDGAATADGGGS
ncbi:CU044_2847 family protein [Streptomyces sp. NBC_00841]|uniref:CU044_2847 family protein n=1 Tax=Streptomyces sp. NBC_00841 TaxID=2975847 RepID=UPI003FA3802C